MRELSQKLTLRAFLTIGAYEEDKGFRDLLDTIARQGMLVNGLIGVITVTTFVILHIALDGKTPVWSYAGYNPNLHLTIIDKSLIFLICVLTAYLSRHSLSLRLRRLMVFVVVWTVCMAMLMDDIAVADVSFSPAYTSFALILAVATIPYKGWQAALLLLTVVASIMLAVLLLPGLLYGYKLDFNLSQVIYLLLITFILTGMSTQLYLNRYRQYTARKHAEELSKKLEERARKLAKMKRKSEQQARRLIKNEQLKNQFFANISHEFRTPLTLILGPLKDLLRSDQDDKQKTIENGVIEIMHRNGLRLLDYINQLLDLSKIDAGQIRLEREAIELTHYVGEIVLGFTPLAEAQKVDLRFQANNHKPLHALVDPEQLERALANLISNAIKYTPKGGTVTVTVSDNGSLPGTLEISVKDTGIGIPEDEIPFIFDRFYRAPTTDGSYRHGTGIGLALAKELVELHDGTIRLSSKVGEGSEFNVLLPKSAVDTQHEIREAAQTYRSAFVAEDFDMHPSDIDEHAHAPEGAPSVLVIDDNADILQYLSLVLSPRYTVITQEDSSEAMKKLQSEKIDLVISDIMMPDPNGFELCRRIKQNPKLCHIPVILLTARAAEKSRLEGLESGADDYISKPFSAAELLVRAENLIELRQSLRRKYSEEIRLKGHEVEVHSEDARFLKNVQQVIEKQMENSNFTVDWLADEVNLSTRQLQRKIRSVTNLSAGGYIRMLRLERASQLLKQQWGNVSEISYKVGFQDPKYFSRLFKQTFGSTPTEYSEARS